MAKVTIKFLETTKEQRRELLRQLQRDTNPAESLKMVLDDMREMEDRYGMGTLEFYARFIKGEMGDSADFISWAGDYEDYQELVRENAVVVTRHKRAA
jgi:hypothetical protein